MMSDRTLHNGTLYVVGTPVGNLGDITLRALETLKSVDFIAAEDTRVTLKLLNRYEIKKPLVSCYEHSGADRIEKIAERIHGGESCAVVSDAGTPCISDPGTELVNACIKLGVNIRVVPGPSALITALSVSGITAPRFSFEGFLSRNKTSRRLCLQNLKDSEYTMVFYEAPHKLLHTLADMLKHWGDRKIVIAKELTKIHENILRTSLSAAIEHYTKIPPRGEYVLIIESIQKPSEPKISLPEAAAAALGYIKDGMPPSEAAKKAAKQSGISKSKIYKEIIQS
ncbi:MAG: 16S rRNA (cytidine(1402)-2'-O)-methyltransferase [Oscillospiraceae bacterium]|nr:16S rRNA (cytidine(1402)-2'-O)-methyltransferase [Oscillospiraceae bacterium]